jgi:radical SAM protein with 4Fe4S-binding SPASM domain
MPASASLEIKQFLWERLKGRRVPLSFNIEITARCNCNCAHCYINLPAGDRVARRGELTITEIGDIARQAVELGAVWCLITGGEPLLRRDFPEIYLMLKRLGLLVSVFTNATLVREEHLALFQKYPPRDLEVTVYGVTRATYERVTRQPGTFDKFRRGLDLLSKGGVPLRLKAMATRSNLHEQGAIAEFCRALTKDYFRFDPQLHLRFDGDPGRNAEIRAERLTPEQIVELERADEERLDSLTRQCDILIQDEFKHRDCGQLFHCGAGNSSFDVSCDGKFRLCPPLWAQETVYDLRRGTLAEAWHDFVPRVRKMSSARQEFQEACQVCPLANLCLWCPAHTHLETGELDGAAPYFCAVAHARAKALGYGKKAEV